MLVLFKNVNANGNKCDVAVPIGKIIWVSHYEGITRVLATDFTGGVDVILIDLPIEQVVGLINQAMGAVAIPDAPERSVVVITGKDAK